MEQIIEHINVNLVPGGVPSICHASQYDEGRIIRAHLLDGILPHTLSGTETIILSMRKPDLSKHVYTLENSSSDYIDIVTTSEMCSIAGESECEFIITDSSNVTGTSNFKMKIESDAYGNSLKTRSVSGPIATFETDLAENLIKLDVDLKPIQDLHGYDGAWPAGGGKNLFDISACVPGYLYGNGKSILSPDKENLVSDFIPVIENQVYVYTSYPTVHDDPWIGWSFYTEKDMGSVIELSSGKYRDVSYNETVRFTTPSGAKYIRIGARYLDNGGNAQVEKGSSATSWTPYSNICPISGHDSAQLVRAGKNLWDEEWEIGTISPNTGGNVANPNKIRSKNLIPVSPDTSYRFTALSTTNDSDFIYFYDENGNYLSYITYTHTTIVSYVFTTPANCKYIRFILKGTTYNHDISISYPSIYTDYEPYKGIEVTVNFGQTVYKGKLYSEQRKVLVTHVCETFDGSEDENWISTTTTSVRYGFRTYFQHNKKPTAQSIDEMLSSVIPLKKSSESSSTDDDIITCRSTTYLYNIFYIFAPPSKISTVEELRVFLANEPETVMYPLNEPFYIDLSQDKIGEVASAPVASFETNLSKELETSEHYFSCSQAEGTPTPDNPIPITGVSEITAHRTGKNLANITISVTNHWGTDTQELVNLLNTLPVGVYTISNKYRIDELPGNNKVQHGRFYITALVDGSQIQVLSYSVVTDTSPIVGKIYEESGTFEITASNKGKFNHAYRCCDQDTTHTGNDRGSYTCYDIQLEKASSATPYESYNVESITVSLGGTYYGGKLVQKEDGSRKIVADMATDSISSSYLSGLDSNYIGYVSSVNAMSGHPCIWVRNWKTPPACKGRVAGGIKSLCNAFKITMNNNDIISTQYRIYFDVYNLNITSVADFISAISSMEQNNKSLDVCYELAEPIEVTLPDGDPLTSLVGQNNVYCNTGDTAVKYYYNMVSDPIRIPALVGENNVYSDAGDVTVEYYAIERR